MFFRSNSSMGKKEMDLVNPLRHGGNSQRQFILEGHVEFAQVNKTDARLQYVQNNGNVGMYQQPKITSNKLSLRELFMNCIYSILF